METPGLRLFQSIERAGEWAGLLDALLSTLAQKERIKHITKALVESCTREKEAIVLLEVLSNLFEDETAFRIHLREIYNNVSNRMKYYSPEPITRFHPGRQLRLKVLSYVIRGWNWPSPLRAENQPSEEAVECFQCICEAYLHPEGDYTELCKGILNLIREHINLYGRHWAIGDLDHWILRKDTPDDIAEVLLHAQIRIGGVPAARERLKLPLT